MPMRHNSSPRGWTLGVKPLIRFALHGNPHRPRSALSRLSDVSALVLGAIDVSAGDRTRPWRAACALYRQYRAGACDAVDCLGHC